MAHAFYEPLKYSAFRVIWIATLFANFGTWMHSLASMTLISTMSHSPFIISCFQASTLLPVFLFSIPAGIVASKVNKSLLLFYARLFMGAVALITFALTFKDLINEKSLIFLTFLLNAGWAFNQPAWQAFSPNLVPKNIIKTAATINNFSYNITRALGPAVGGLLYSHLGASWVFLLNSISFLGPILIFYKWKNSSSFEKSIELKTEVQYSIYKILFLPLFRNILIKSFIFFMFSSVIWVILPYMVIVKMKMDSIHLGILTSCIGLGAVINIFILDRLRRVFSESSLVNLTTLISIISMICISLTNNLSIIAFILTFFGLAWAASVSLFNGILQFSFDNVNRAKAIGIYCVAFALSQVIGSFITGISIERVGYKTTLIFSSLFLLINIIFSRLFKLEEDKSIQKGINS